MARTGVPVTPRRGSASNAAPGTVPVPPAAAGIPSASEATATAIALEEGLYAIEIGAVQQPMRHVGGVDYPMISLSQLPSGDQPLTTLSADGLNQRWLDPQGGVVVVRSPASGAQVLVTVFGAPDLAAPPAPEIQVRSLDRAEGPDPFGHGIGGQLLRRDREVPLEVLLHIERLGDAVFAGAGWLGNRGQRLRIEAFSLTPLEGIAPEDIEYKGLNPGTVETPWVHGRELCGTRGRAMPLTGFAIQLAPHLQGEFEVIYYGAFFNAGVVGPIRSGQPCQSPLAGDPLEAVNIRIIQRIAG